MLYSDLPNDVGHIKLAVRTEDLGNGNYRYNYTLANFDVEHGLEGIRFPGFEGDVNSVSFHDPDHDMTNDWAANSAGGFG